MSKCWFPPFDLNDAYTYKSCWGQWFSSTALIRGHLFIWLFQQGLHICSAAIYSKCINAKWKDTHVQAVLLHWVYWPTNQLQKARAAAHRHRQPHLGCTLCRAKRWHKYTPAMMHWDTKLGTNQTHLASNLTSLKDKPRNVSSSCLSRRSIPWGRSVQHISCATICWPGTFSLFFFFTRGYFYHVTHLHHKRRQAP